MAGHYGSTLATQKILPRRLARGVDDLCAREQAVGLAVSRLISCLLGRSKPPSATFSISWSRVKRTGKIHRGGMALPVKGKHAPELLRDSSGFIDYTVDRNPHKQGKFLPGSHIPILAPGRIQENQARLRVDSALESEGRNHASVILRSRMGAANLLCPFPTLRCIAELIKCIDVLVDSSGRGEDL